MFCAKVYRGNYCFNVVGKSVGQVRRILVQMGVDPFDDKIEIKEAKDNG